MKKTAFIALFVLVFLSTTYYELSTIRAQSFNSDKAYQDYQFQFTSYQNSLADYQTAVGFYKKNPTLQLQEDARKKTLAMLKIRDLLMSSYLTAIRTKLDETTGFSGDDKAVIYAKIDPEVAWYQSHITNYSNDDDLPTLFNKSDESKSRYQNTTKFIVYEGLFDISLSQVVGIRTDHQNVYSNLKDYINTQVSEGKMTMDPFNRWLNDTDSVLSALTQNEDDAKKKIATIYNQYNSSQAYNSGVAILGSSIDQLSQLNNYLTEMLTTIENQNQ